MLTTPIPPAQAKRPQEGFAGTQFRLAPGRITRLLALALCGLTIASVAGQLAIYCGGYTTFGGVIPLFDLDDERNIPTWFSSTGLLLCAVFLGLIAAAKKRERDGYTWDWQVLAIIFLGLSLDEAAGLHELTVKPLRSMLGADGMLLYTWVVLGAAFLVLFMAAYLRFFLNLPPDTRWLFAVAGTVYVSGALGMELVGGYYASLHGHRNLMFATLTTIEEVGEMAGVLIFIYALLSYISTYIREVTIHIGDQE